MPGESPDSSSAGRRPRRWTQLAAVLMTAPLALSAAGCGGSAEGPDDGGDGRGGQVAKRTTPAPGPATRPNAPSLAGRRKVTGVMRPGSADGRVRFAMATARKSASGATGVRIITRQGRFQDIEVAPGATIRLQVLGGSLAYQAFPVEALNGKLRAYAAAAQPQNGSADKEAALDKVGLRVSFDDRGRATAITEIAHD